MQWIEPSLVEDIDHVNRAGSRREVDLNTETASFVHAERGGRRVQTDTGIAQYDSELI